VNDFIIPGTDIDIHTLPKVSLHDHLDGGLRPGTILELADAVGWKFRRPFHEQTH